MDSPRTNLILFDVDGTLTFPRQVIEPGFYSYLINEVKALYTIGLVGGSDLGKILEQLGGNKALQDFDFIFAENGITAYHDGNVIGSESIQDTIGEENLQKFINFSLEYMSKLTLPFKRGTFIEFRSGMVNLCPVGRSCSQSEREQFAAYDEKHGIRKKFVRALQEKFPSLGLSFSIGGQISIDVFPNGWDKTYCLKFLDGFPIVHFYGDKTNPGENDYEIYEHSKTVGHKVTGPQDTIEQLKKLMML